MDEQGGVGRSVDKQHSSFVSHAAIKGKLCLLLRHILRQLSLCLENNYRLRSQLQRCLRRFPFGQEPQLLQTHNGHLLPATAMTMLSSHLHSGGSVLPLSSAGRA